MLQNARDKNGDGTNQTRGSGICLMIDHIVSFFFPSLQYIARYSMKRLVPISDDESSEEVFECFTCDKTRCTCKRSVCNVCENDDSCKYCTLKCHEFEFQARTITTRCSVCTRVACRLCIVWCDQCANECGKSPSICKTCATDRLTKIVCNYHTWHRCNPCIQRQKDNHEDTDECGECSTNARYAGRYGVM